MKNKKAADLVQRLIANRISRKELEAFLDGLDDEEQSKEYEAQLNDHFEKTMTKYIKEKEKEKKQTSP